MLSRWSLAFIHHINSNAIGILMAYVKCQNLFLFYFQIFTLMPTHQVDNLLSIETL